MVVAVPQGAKLVLATHNKGKLAEFREILAQAIADFDPASVISAAEKNAISHRGQALRALAPQLAQLF